MTFAISFDSGSSSLLWKTAACLFAGAVLGASSCLAAASATVPPQRQSQPAATPEDLARSVAHLLVAQRFADIVPFLGPEMKVLLPASDLAAAWQACAIPLGGLQEMGSPRLVKVGASQVVTLPLRFERGALNLVVTDEAGTIAGLFLRPGEVAGPAWTSAPYVDPSSFHTVEIHVTDAGLSLPGTLYLPKTSEKVAAVVLVHGSGPNDRDERIGANRPFRDLAEGLASRGIAVLAYDKRTKVAPQAFAALRNPTVRDETMDDADAAVALLRARVEIDPSRIIVLGHSLGGTVAPRLAQGNSAIAGLVLLAAAARPLPDLIVEQTRYLASLRGLLDATSNAQLETIEAEASTARALQPGDAGPPIFNAPRSFWADLNGYDPATTARDLSIPILILQGGRDYQVTIADFDRFRSVLSGRANVSFKMLSTLNHLFISGNGLSMPSEYRQPGHVDIRVIAAIVEFVRSIGATSPRG